jgi:hypothetical protein
MVMVNSPLFQNAPAHKYEKLVKTSAAGNLTVERVVQRSTNSCYNKSISPTVVTSTSLPFSPPAQAEEIVEPDI